MVVLPPFQILVRVPDGGVCYGCRLFISAGDDEPNQGICGLRLEDKEAHFCRPGHLCPGPGRYELFKLPPEVHRWYGMEDNQ